MGFRKGLCIGIPFTDRPLPREWAWTLAQMEFPMNCDLWWEKTDCMEIAEARNHLAETAQLHGARWLWFLDEDVVPPVNAVRLLIQAMETHPDAAMVGGIYTEKDEFAAPMVFEDFGAGAFWDWTIDDVFPVKAVATGCSLINAGLLERIPKPWFRTVEEQFERWTEDMWFCRQIAEAGLRVLAHGGVLCRHFDLKTGESYFLPSGTQPYQRYREKHGHIDDAREPGSGIQAAH
jgi:GT2 family glycosyltransferase